MEVGDVVCTTKNSMLWLWNPFFTPWVKNVVVDVYLFYYREQTWTKSDQNFCVVGLIAPKKIIP